MSLTVLEKRIAELIPSYSRGQVKKFAKKVQHLCTLKQTPAEFERALKIFGIYSDPTAMHAITKIMKEA